MSLRVERLDDIARVPSDEWQAVVERAGASIFYSWNLISAYAAHPLLPAAKGFYFVMRDESRVVRAVLPAYLQENFDPFNLVYPHVPVLDASRRRGLLTHFWHCYDTAIVADDVDKDLTECLVRSLAETARECDASCYGFINVPQASQSGHALQSTGFEPLQIWERFQLDVSEFDTFDDYLSRLTPVDRRSLQRQSRLMAEAEAVCRMEVLPFERLDEVIALCHGTAVRRGTGFYYEPQRLKSFLLQCAEAVRVSCVYMRDELLCAFICFADAARLHVWAGGVRYDLSRFSPYVVAFAEAIRHAIENGYKIVEGGRGNGPKKQALGFQALPLSAFIACSP